jgi:NADH dehydrogenase [ubiquinone] 1 alpha subcomplex assembly factor 1
MQRKIALQASYHNAPRPREISVNPRLLFDFSDATSVRDWAAIDDRVMGGESQSRLRHDPRGHAAFEGVVSLERNGGFASVRSIPGDRGQPGAQVCQIELRGSSKQFKLNLLTDDGFDNLSYQASFEPSGNEWLALSLPLAAFRASFRGRTVPGAPPLDPARVRQVGLMIAARQAGPFTLDIRRISLA